jgi:hypothetical protein
MPCGGAVGYQPFGIPRDLDMQGEDGGIAIVKTLNSRNEITYLL